MDTMDLARLREQLLGYVRKKFYTRRNILDMAEDIVNQAFLDVGRSPSFDESLYNFGYMSVACLRVAYWVFHRSDVQDTRTVSIENTRPLVEEAMFIDEIKHTEDTAAILASLATLKRIERIVIEERYYGTFSFREISQRHAINLNTILSHHRRVLEKLRPIVSGYGAALPREVNQFNKKEKRDE